MKNARWEDEELNFEHPDPNKIVCKDCAFRAEDNMWKGKVALLGSVKGGCAVYESKPMAVLYDGSTCAFYRKEKTE